MDIMIASDTLEIKIPLRGAGNQGAQYLRDSIIMQYLPIFEDFREVYLQSLLRWIIKDKY